MRFLVHDDVISAMIIIKDSQKNSFLLCLKKFWAYISINKLIIVTTTKNVFFKRYDVFFLLKFFLI